MDTSLNKSINTLRRMKGMNKKHLIKAMAISALMSLSICSAVYAETVSRSAYVRSVAEYGDANENVRGTYIATGEKKVAKTSLASKHSGTLYGTIYTAEYNYTTGDYVYTSNMSVVASHGDTFERELARNKDSAVVDYIHNIQMYYSSSKNSTTLADSYIYTAMQYYR